MTSLRFNKKHKYIYSVTQCAYGYSVDGCIGKKFYILHTLKEAIKRYNATAKSIKSMK